MLGLNKGKSVHCCICGEEMEMEDIDESFKGNYNAYLLCHTPSCNVSAIAKVRYNKLLAIEFYKGEEVIKVERFSDLDGSEFGG